MLTVFKSQISNLKSALAVALILAACALPLRAAKITPTGPPPSGLAVIGGAATGIVAPGPNLLKNGEFEKGTDWPEGWEKTKAPGATARTSAGVSLQLVDGGAGHGRVAHMKMDTAAAEMPGMMLLSEPIPVTEGKTYHLSVEVKSMGPMVTIFVKGYGILKGRDGAVKETTIYEKKQDSRLKKGEWGVMSFDFTPRYRMMSENQRRVFAKRGVQIPSLDYIRVELLAYYPAGEVYYDNARVTAGATAPAAYITAPEKH